MSIPLTVGANGPAVGSQLSGAPEPLSAASPEIRANRWPGGMARFAGQVFVGLAPSSWLLLDLLLISVGVAVGYLAFELPQIPVPHIKLWQSLAVFAFAMTAANMVFGLYERETITSRSRILTRGVLTAAATIAVAYALIYVVMYATVSRRVTGIALGVHLLASSACRFWACWAVHAVQRSLLVVGPRALYDSFKRAHAEGLLSEYRLVGYSTPRESKQDEFESDYLGAFPTQLDRINRKAVQDIVLSRDAVHDSEVRHWMLPCLQRGCRVTNEAIFYEKATGQILVDEITPEWFLFADLKVHCDEEATLKRAGDIITAAVALLVTAPLWPLIALAIKLCDGGPVFYSQTRVGQNGQPFNLYKFRTMRTDAENGRSIWASPNDSRVTAVGRWLRRSRFDELPQLFNVLVGQMSIVGPRPERPDIVEALSESIPYYAERHLVKPGVTGWAQISFRYGSTFEDAKRKLQFDLYYLKHMSFELDMIILFRTLGTFLRGGC